VLAGGRWLPTLCQWQCCSGGVGEGLPLGTGEALRKWAMCLTGTQSGVRLWQYVKCRGGEGGCEKPVSYLLVHFCSSLFCDIMCYLCQVQKALCSVSYEEKNTDKSQQPPASPLHGKIQTLGNHRKSPAHLEPKILIPQTRKATIHRDVQVERPKPFHRVHQTKESCG